MNVVKSVQNRISNRLTETKNPCKTYATYETADKIGETFAKDLGKYFDSTGKESRYIVVYIKELNRYTPAFDYSELFSRKNAIGGYVGVAANKGFYTY